MTATLKRVWAHYRIASMVKATPDESATYLKEVKKEQRTRGYDWASSTWNRYRERAAALFTYAERNQLVPKGSNPFTEARCKDYVEFKQGVPARRIPVDVQEAIYTAIDQRWGASKRFPHVADEMRRRFKFAFATSTRRGEMLRIQRAHCDYVRQDGSNAIQLYPDAENGSPRKVIRIDVPVQLTKGGKMTGRAFTRYVAVREAVAILEERMEKFKDRPEAYLFGTEDGRRVKSFPSWTKVFKDVGLKVGRGHGHFRYHDTRHEAISTA